MRQHDISQPSAESYYNSSSVISLTFYSALIFGHKFPWVAILILLMAGWADTILGQPITITNQHPSISSIGKNLWVLEDPTGMLTIADIEKPEWQSRFTKVESPVFTDIWSDSFFWFKIDVELQSKGRFYFYICDVRFDEITFAFLQDSSWTSLKDRSSVPLRQKAIRSDFQVLPIGQAIGETKTYYFRVQPRAVPFPVKIISESYLNNKLRVNAYVVCAFTLGIFFFIFINNIIAYFTSRNSLRLIYSAIPISFAIWTLFFNGHHRAIFGSFDGGIVMLILKLLGFWGHFWVILFGLKSLQLKKYSLWLTRWNQTVLLISALGFLITAISYNKYIYFTNVLVTVNALVTLFTCLLNGTWVWAKSEKKQRQIAMIYTFSYIAFFIASITVVFDFAFDLGIHDTILISPLDVGFLCEVTGLSVSLNIQLENEKKELREGREKAIQDHLDLVTMQNQLLEERVSQRTTELASKNEATEKLNAKLRDLNELKDKLFSIISHDLRAPLNQLYSFLHLLDLDSDNRDQLNKEFLPIIKDNLKNVTDLTNDLLYWSKSQLEGFHLNPVMMELFPLAEEKRLFFSDAARKKGVTIYNKIPRLSIGCSDKDVINLVLRNLLNNAIKFSRADDSITLCARENGENILISVIDTGVGISEKGSGVLFKEFYSTRGTTKEAGSGLGLIICKELLLKQGGKIWFESKPQIGTTFHFTIPARLEILQD